MNRANHDLYVTYHLGGVMIIVITLDMVHHGFNVRSGITEDDAINNIVFHLSLLLLSSYLISVSMLLHQIVNS
jgi:hypothetical protein